MFDSENNLKYVDQQFRGKILTDVGVGTSSIDGPEPSGTRRNAASICSDWCYLCSLFFTSPINQGGGVGTYSGSEVD